MISISSYPTNNNYNLMSMQPKRVETFCGADISDLLAKGDKALNENRHSDALQAYQHANQTNPDEISVYRKLAKAQFNLKNYKEAEKNFLFYLEKNPNDTDTWIELGENQRQSGHYQKALKSFEKAASLDNTNDLAKRSILETKNNILSIYTPERAKAEKAAYAEKNLREALEMTVKYMSPNYMKSLNDVTVEFGKTAVMGGTSNIAQYENNRKKMMISDSYIYAAPQLIAAYLTHESVHAKDKDAYTSIKEEQDAYEIATKFWISNANGVKDPEMDYAASLYKKSASTLKERVAEIYKLRDPNIAETSPNHPPKKIFHSNKQNAKVASQSIKEYNVIA